MKKTLQTSITVIIMLLLSQSSFAQSLVNKNEFVINDGTKIVLLCHLDNDGTITANQSDFIFASSANQNIDGVNSISFIT